MLVGIDSLNIDDTRKEGRPVHSTLLCTNIPIIEHVTIPRSLVDPGSRFSPAPIKFKIKSGHFQLRH